MVVYVPFFKVIVIFVDMFESSVIDERHFSNCSEAEEFANKYKCSGGGYWLLFFRCNYFYCPDDYNGGCCPVHGRHLLN